MYLDRSLCILKDTYYYDMQKERHAKYSMHMNGTVCWYVDDRSTRMCHDICIGLYLMHACTCCIHLDVQTQIGFTERMDMSGFVVGSERQPTNRFSTDPGERKPTNGSSNRSLLYQKSVWGVQPVNLF